MTRTDNQRRIDTVISFILATLLIGGWLAFEVWDAAYGNGPVRIEESLER